MSSDSESEAAAALPPRIRAVAAFVAALSVVALFDSIGSLLSFHGEPSASLLILAVGWVVSYVALHRPNGRGPTVAGVVLGTLFFGFVAMAFCGIAETASPVPGLIAAGLTALFTVALRAFARWTLRSWTGHKEPVTRAAILCCVLCVPWAILRAHDTGGAVLVPVAVLIGAAVAFVVSGVSKPMRAALPRFGGAIALTTLVAVSTVYFFRSYEDRWQGPRWEIARVLGFEGARIERLAARNGVVCASQSGETFRCWGDRKRLFDRAEGARKVAPLSIPGVERVVIGPKTVCVLFQDQSAPRCATAIYNVPVPVYSRLVGLDHPRDVAIDSDNVFGIEKSGAIFEYHTPSEGATVVVGVPPARAVVADGHRCAVTEAGDIFCWGPNQDHQCTGEEAESVAPRKANLPRPAIQVSVTYGETFALLEDGTLYRWGRNGYDDSKRPDAVPVPFPLPSPLSRVVLGYQRGCGVTRKNELLCWGRYMDEKSVPPTVLPTQGAVRLLEGDGKTMCFADDGGLKCWGWY